MPGRPRVRDSFQSTRAARLRNTSILGCPRSNGAPVGRGAGVRGGRGGIRRLRRLPQRREQKPVAEFERDIAPLLRTRCQKCHGEGKPKGGLDLRSMSGILQGGESGDPAIVPGKASRGCLSGS